MVREVVVIAKWHFEKAADNFNFSRRTWKNEMSYLSLCLQKYVACLRGKICGSRNVCNNVDSLG
jgi:hypothetical protein